MTDLQSAFEALMPEPARPGDPSSPYPAYRTSYYTLDQMRQAIQATSDLAAKREREECHRLVEMFPCRGVDVPGIFDAITQIAAAIRARDGSEHGKA